MKLGVIAFSNSLTESDRPIFEKFKLLLEKTNYDIYFSSYLFKNKDNLNLLQISEKKALEANEFMQAGVKVLLDISGGDTANLVLEYLNFDLISQNKVKYVGYSDNSVILNSICSQAKLPSFYYCPRLIAEDESGQQLNYFLSTVLDFKLNEPAFKYEFLRGDSLSGEVLGGNLRCTLKIAGIRFFPDFTDKILFLESLSGGLSRISSYLHEYYMLGVFDKIKGLIIGNFSELQEKFGRQSVLDVFEPYLDKSNYPIIITDELGHNVADKCIPFGFFNFFYTPTKKPMHCPLPKKNT